MQCLRRSVSFFADSVFLLPSGKGARVRGLSEAHCVRVISLQRLHLLIAPHSDDGACNIGILQRYRHPHRSKQLAVAYAWMGHQPRRFKYLSEIKSAVLRVYSYFPL